MFILMCTSEHISPEVQQWCLPPFKTHVYNRPASAVAEAECSTIPYRRSNWKTYEVRLAQPGVFSGEYEKLTHVSHELPVDGNSKGLASLPSVILLVSSTTPATFSPWGSTPSSGRTSCATMYQEHSRHTANKTPRC